MKIYSIDRGIDRRTKRHFIPAEVPELKIAAGGEDIVILSDEALKSFRRENFNRNRELELKKLALRHINDYRPELEELENDQEFIMAEKLSLLAELVIRVTPSEKSSNIYKRVTDFVIEQMAGKDNLD